jgi:hypothetical protein
MRLVKSVTKLVVPYEAERAAVGYTVRTLHPGAGDSDEVPAWLWAVNWGKEGKSGD